MFLQDWIRLDLNALAQEKVRLSSDTAKLVQDVMHGLQAKKFRHDFNTLVYAKPAQQMLKIGLEYASEERTEDFLHDGRKLLVLRIPVAAQEYMQGYTEFAHASARSEVSATHALYQEKLANTFGHMVVHADKRYAGLQVRFWRANEGTSVHEGFDRQQTTPSWGKIDLAFDLSKPRE